MVQARMRDSNEFVLYLAFLVICYRASASGDHMSCVKGISYYTTGNETVEHQESTTLGRTHTQPE